MQRHKFFLRGIPEGLIAGFSDSVLRICVVSFVFLVLIVSCGPST